MQAELGGGARKGTHGIVTPSAEMGAIALVLALVRCTASAAQVGAPAEAGAPRADAVEVVAADDDLEEERRVLAEVVEAVSRSIESVRDGATIEPERMRRGLETLAWFLSDRARRCKVRSARCPERAAQAEKAGSLADDWCDAALRPQLRGCREWRALDRPPWAISIDVDSSEDEVEPVPLFPPQPPPSSSQLDREIRDVLARVPAPHRDGELGRR